MLECILYTGKTDHGMTSELKRTNQSLDRAGCDNTFTMVSVENDRKTTIKPIQMDIRRNINVHCTRVTDDAAEQAVLYGERLNGTVIQH